MLAGASATVPSRMWCKCAVPVRNVSNSRARGGPRGQRVSRRLRERGRVGRLTWSALHGRGWGGAGIDEGTAMGRVVGGSGIEVSEIGFGCGALGGAVRVEGRAE